MEELINRLEKRKADLTAQSQKTDDINELRSINQQLSTLNEDLASLRAEQSKVAANQKDDQTDERTAAVNADTEGRSDAPKFIQGKGFIATEERDNKNLVSALEQREKAGTALKENRAVKSPLSTFGELREVTVTPAAGSPATIILPSHTSETIHPDFPVVSSLVDAVGHISLNGGDSFSQAYITDIDTGAYTDEGEDAAEAETRFSYAKINRTKITAYAEISKELEKLPSAPYADVVFQNIRTSMRKLLTKEILIGSGGTNQIVGIFSDKATAIDASTDLELSAITDTTLDEILFRYGNDEEVESPAVLIVSKLDLLAFSKVRTSTKQKFYDIQLHGNGGTISGVPFIINSACKSLMTATDKGGAAVGDYCMAYGALSGYTLVEFSQMSVERSNDYKFRQGMRAFLGECYFGGNVTRKNGFLRIKKSA